jgi:hypothetical protein
MQYLFTVMILALFSNAINAQDALMQDAITRPALGLRCKELHKQRSDKVKIQQRLNALLQRNQSLIKKSPKTERDFARSSQLKSDSN